MNQQVSMFGLALLLLILITSVILGLAAGPSSPLTWLLVAFLVAIPFIHKRLTTRRYIEWQDSYSVGINSIDQQHKKLVNLINQLQTAVDYSTGEEFEREALDALVDYTKTHFGHEESLMQQYGYPGYEPHTGEHKKMIREVEALLAEYDKDPEQAIQRALNFLKEWLIDHINGTDKQYSSFLRDKGAQ